MPTKAPADSAQMHRKSAVIDDIKARLESADAAVLTEYRGLTVKDIAYKIFKNTLARRAARDAGLDDIVESLEGPIAIAFVRRDGGDAVTAAKALRDFARTNPNLVLKGGILGPRLLTSRDVEALADVPPREQLLARLAGGFQAPMVKAAGLFQAFTRNMAYGVKALIDQRIAGGEAAPAEPAAEVADEAPESESPAEPTEIEAPAAEATEPEQASENEE